MKQITFEGKIKQSVIPGITESRFTHTVEFKEDWRLQENVWSIGCEERRLETLLGSTAWLIGFKKKEDDSSIYALIKVIYASDEEGDEPEIEEVKCKIVR